MGRILTKRIEIIATLSEIVGYKAGLALTQPDIVKHLSKHKDIISGNNEQIIGIRSELFESLTSELLYKVGNISIPQVVFPGIRLFHKYKNDPNAYKILCSVMDIFTKKISGQLRNRVKNNNTIHLEPFIKECAKRYGPGGGLIAIEFLEDLNLYQHASPWTSIRRIEWQDQKELSDLFQGESLNTFYGYFFDQRFIDYLYRNFQSIDEINWRKFEGLVCEFFKRHGLYVEIGKGRNDDNIDCRIWSDKKLKGQSPIILVQCKRQKDKIGKVVVKALYADILENKAKSGLIVTTSSLSRGAKKTCIARAYPIAEVNRQTLESWLEAMRSPYSGVFLGE